MQVWLQAVSDTVGCVWMRVCVGICVVPKALLSTVVLFRDLQSGRPTQHPRRNPTSFVPTYIRFPHILYDIYSTRIQARAPRNLHPNPITNQFFSGMAHTMRTVLYLKSLSVRPNRIIDLHIGSSFHHTVLQFDGTPLATPLQSLFQGFGTVIPTGFLTPVRT